MSNDHPDHPADHRAAEATEPTVPLGPAGWGAASPDEDKGQISGTATTTVPPHEPPPHEVADRRPLSVGYLVTGLVFLGISGLWLAREVGVIELEDLDLLVPMLLVVVGAAGLLAGLLRAARRG